MKRAIRIIAVLIRAVAGIATTPALHGTQAIDPDPVTKLLRDAGTQATQISTDAATLKAWVRQARFDWAGHADEIEHMKNNFRAASLTVGKLNDLRGSAAPWQCDVEDKIIPLMKELSDSASSVIAFLDDNQKLPSKAGDCREFTDANFELSRHLSGLITHLIDYGSGLAKFENAKRALELSLAHASR